MIFPQPKDNDAARQAMLALGPQGAATITSGNRGEVKKWLTSYGIPFSISGKMSLAILSTVYNDDTGGQLNRWLKATPVKVYVDSEFTDRQTLKSLGAIWDKEESKWYHWQGLTGFEQWEENAPAPAPVAPQTAPQTDTTDDAKAIQALRALLGSQAAPLDEKRVLELIQTHSTHTTITIEAVEPKTYELPDTPRHSVFANVLSAVGAKVNVLLVGPAGSGKTTIGEQIAEALEIPFYFSGAIASEYKLSGFVDAQGRICSTQFREAYTNGGLFLFDELDASLPQAVLAFNAALSNGHSDFPGELEPTVRHENFRVIASANTYGNGADRVYVGRNQLDAASLDRFAVFAMDYDPDLERAIFTARDNWAWISRCQSVRSAVKDLKLRHIVSPRAIDQGLAMLAAGINKIIVEKATIFRSLDAATIRKIEAGA